MLEAQTQIFSRIKVITKKTLGTATSGGVPVELVFPILSVILITYNYSDNGERALISPKLETRAIILGRRGVYDKAYWRFMFQFMEQLGMPNSFTHTIRFLFQDPVVLIKNNDQATKPSNLHRGVRQGCPLAPYLFVIIAEALNVVVKNALRIGHIEGICLQCIAQQIICQYVDDMSSIVRTKEASVDNLNLVNILQQQLGLLQDFFRFLAKFSPSWSHFNNDCAPLRARLVGWSASTSPNYVGPYSPSA